jgi:hypothetical protein
MIFLGVVPFVLSALHAFQPVFIIDYDCFYSRDDPEDFCSTDSEYCSCLQTGQHCFAGRIAQLVP